ncbi:hypothetical protein OIU76_009189 [Salix suchowensis]|nr:hypothetical protein OIU76_009189 [Salix suchowensis]
MFDQAVANGDFIGGSGGGIRSCWRVNGGGREKKVFKRSVGWRGFLEKGGRCQGEKGMAPFKCDGGKVEERRESFVGITTDMAIEFLRRRVATCESGGSWFIVRERGGKGMERILEFNGEYGGWSCRVVGGWVSDG